MGGLLFFVDEPKVEKSGTITHRKTIKPKLEIVPRLLKESFHAHEFDTTARSLELKGPKNARLKCSYTEGKSFVRCSPGEVLSWSRGAYRNGFNFVVEDESGNLKRFSPRKHNPSLSFHKCDRYLKNKTTELTFRKVVNTIKDKNRDGIKILCLGSNQEITLTEGPLLIKGDLAIIGTHHKTPVIKTAGNFPIFKNENKTLFLYNLELSSTGEGAYGLSLGVGSYLGADNLKIVVNGDSSEGIHCFGCTIDGDRVKIETYAANSKALSSSLGLLELRWAKFTAFGEDSVALSTNMGSFTNVLESSQFTSNETGPTIKMNESGLFFSGGEITQNGQSAAVYMEDLAKYVSEFDSIKLKSKSIGIMVKNAKNVFLSNMQIETLGASMVNLGETRVSQN